MSADPITFTLGDTEIEVEAACFGPNLDRIKEGNAAEGVKDAFRQLIQLFNVQLPDVLQDMGEQIAGAVGGMPAAAGYEGDLVWTKTGNGLPAQAEGGQGGDNVVGHINEYDADGVSPLPYAASPAAPAGAYVTLLQDLHIDPVRHLARRGAYWNYAAKPFTVSSPWLSYNTTTDVITHEVTAAPAGISNSFVAPAGSAIGSLYYDAKKHVLSAAYVGVGNVYTDALPWISLNGLQITHGITAAPGGISNSFAAPAGSAIGSLYYDAKKHVLSAAYVGVGNVYTDALPWISLNGLQITHGVTAAPGGISNSFAAPANSAIGTLYYDAKQHVLSAAYVAVGAAYTAETPWISLNGTQICHSVTAASANSYGGAGNYVCYLAIDARNHVVAASASALPVMSAGNAWISVSTGGGYYVAAHSLPNPHVSTGSFDAGVGSAVRIIYYDSYKHIVGISAIAV